MRFGLGLGAACVFAVIVGAACSSNPYKDAHCSPDSPSIAVDPDCIYAGNGHGPRFKEPACAAPDGTKPANCTGTFDAVIAMMSDSTRGNCTATACHGDPDVNTVGIYLDSGDPAGFYQTLTSITGTVGTPYVVPDDTTTADNEALGSWIQCNVAATQGGGYPMPQWSGLTDPKDIQVVTDWLLCGAPGPK